MIAMATGAALANDGGVAVTGIVYGSITVGVNRYQVEPFPVMPMNPPATVAPSRLLDARYQIVPFTGRERQLDTLYAWRDGNDEDRAVMLLHGAGGQGKTRLATQFAAASARQGWQVAQARHDTALHQPMSGTTPPLPPAPAGVLVIVDYAERWPLEDLRAVFARLLRPGGRVRVLLLSRPAGYWWQALGHQLGKIDVACSELLLGACQVVCVS